MDNDFWYKLIQINVNIDDKDITDTINTLFDNKTFDNINLVKNCDTKYNEKSQDNSDDEEIFIEFKQEYAVVMSALETWLKTSNNYKNSKYIKKEIGVPLKKETKINKNKYIIINKILSNETYR